MKEIIVGPNEAGQRMDKLLKKYLKEASPGFLYKMLRKKNITLNGKKAEGRVLTEKGDRIQIYFSEAALEKFTGKSQKNNLPADEKTENNYAYNKLPEYQKAYDSLKGITILFENEHIILLNKPRGVLSQKAEKKDLSLNEWLIGYLLSAKKITPPQLDTFRPSICNRLDRNTSGLVICGKTYAGSRQMNEWIRDRKIKKYYRLFLIGDLKESLQLTGYLKKDSRENKAVVSFDPKKGTSPIETYVAPIFNKGGITYAEVELVTGKTHQIRAHLSAIGYPLLGDEKYGNKTSVLLGGKSFFQQGQLLHSYRILFPETDFYPDISNREFLAPEPEYFLKLKEEIITERKGE